MNKVSPDLAPNSWRDGVLKAINAVQEELSKTGVSKDRRSTGSGSFKFRGIDDMYSAVAPLFSQYGLVIIPSFDGHRVEVRESKAGGALNYAFVRGTFTLYSVADGSSVTGHAIGEAMDSSDKATNKAMSIALKYFLMQTFTIPTDADNDPDATVHEPTPARPRATAPPPARTGEELEKAASACLMGMAELVPKGMGAIQEYMDRLSPEVQSHIRANHKDAMKSIANAVKQAQVPAREPGSDDL